MNTNDQDNVRSSAAQSVATSLSAGNSNRQTGITMDFYLEDGTEHRLSPQGLPSDVTPTGSDFASHLTYRGSINEAATASQATDATTARPQQRTRRVTYTISPTIVEFATEWNGVLAQMNEGRTASTFVIPGSAAATAQEADTESQEQLTSASYVQRNYSSSILSYYFSNRDSIRPAGSVQLTPSQINQVRLAALAQLEGNTGRTITIEIQGGGRHRASTSVDVSPEDIARIRAEALAQLEGRSG